MLKTNIIQSDFIQELSGYEMFDIKVFLLTNTSGNYVELTNYGAIVKSIVVPDRNGAKENVVLGYSNLKGYVDDNSYIGATVGPFANRIENACFSIDNISFTLDKNDSANNNHSGSAGFHKKIFAYELSENSVLFTLSTAGGEGGFPGGLEVKVKYTWTDANELIIEYTVATDTPTPVNLTNHCYFNLSGCSDNIEKHSLNIASNRVLESRPDYIPTGNVVPAGKLALHGQLLNEVMPGEGLNDYYIFHDPLQNIPQATLCHEESGRSMEVFTSYPGIQVYTSDYLEGEYLSQHNKKYQPRDGVCLECQFYPDSPNHPNFPDTILRPGNTYNHFITYKFGLQQ